MSFSEMNPQFYVAWYFHAHDLKHYQGFSAGTDVYCMGGEL